MFRLSFQSLHSIPFHNSQINKKKKKTNSPNVPNDTAFSKIRLTHQVDWTSQVVSLILENAVSFGPILVRAHSIDVQC